MAEQLSGEWRLRPVLAAVISTGKPVRGTVSQVGAPAPPAPFFTISREVGAGGNTLAQALVLALNRHVDAGERPWEAYDRELVEKVAADHHISSSLIASLGDSGHSWFREVLSGLPGDSAEPSEFNLYRRVAQTIRALAQAGRVVLVGRGGVYITHRMPGGIHVRLVAPLEHRVNNMARQLNLNPGAAADHVRRLDKNRAAFYHHYWPQFQLTPDTFTITFNTAQLTEDQMTDTLATLMLRRPRPRLTGVS